MKNNIQTKEAKIMATAIRLQRDTDEYIRDLDEYITKLRSLPLDTAVGAAKAALLATGIITEEGIVKEQIVSWE